MIEWMVEVDVVDDMKETKVFTLLRTEGTVRKGEQVFSVKTPTMYDGTVTALLNERNQATISGERHLPRIGQGQVRTKAVWAIPDVERGSGTGEIARVALIQGRPRNIRSGTSDSCIAASVEHRKR
jgi:hypothetical protein